MFKNRAFLIGLGAGLIAGALLLQISIGVRDANGKAPVSEQQIRQLAENKGFVMVTKKEFDDLNNKIVASSLPKPSATNPTSAPSVTPNAASSSQVLPSPSPNVMRIYIAEGMGSKEVSSYLVEVGIIADKVAFEQRIKERGVESKLKKGPYSMKPNMTADEAINVLTHASN